MPFDHIRMRENFFSKLFFLETFFDFHFVARIQAVLPARLGRVC